jgi:hypothetical protein
MVDRAYLETRSTSIRNEGWSAAAFRAGGETTNGDAASVAHVADAGSVGGLWSCAELNGRTWRRSAWVDRRGASMRVIIVSDDFIGDEQGSAHAPHEY